MDKETSRLRNSLQIDGRSEVRGAETITVIDKDADGNILRATGTTKPTDATAGYAKGALFIDTDVVTGTSGLYVNVGTSASCVFKLVTNAA